MCKPTLFRGSGNFLFFYHNGRGKIDGYSLVIFSNINYKIILGYGLMELLMFSNVLSIIY